MREDVIGEDKDRGKDQGKQTELYIYQIFEQLSGLGGIT